jgi:hypothetical protein
MARTAGETTKEFATVAGGVMAMAMPLSLRVLAVLWRDEQGRRARAVRVPMSRTAVALSRIATERRWATCWAAVLAMASWRARLRCGSWRCCSRRSNRLRLPLCFALRRCVCVYVHVYVHVYVYVYMYACVYVHSLPQTFNHARADANIYPYMCLLLHTCPFPPSAPRALPLTHVPRLCSCSSGESRACGKDGGVHERRPHAWLPRLSASPERGGDQMSR